VKVYTRLFEDFASLRKLLVGWSSILNLKLKLLTNVTVVDDAIRFVASHTAAHKTIEKANSDDRPTLDEQNSDIQGSKENRSKEQQSTTTNNPIF
jgi:hypothetical protein